MALASNIFPFLSAFIVRSSPRILRGLFACLIFIALASQPGTAAAKEKKKDKVPKTKEEIELETLKKERKKTLLVKRKWFKRDYEAYARRREKNGLPIVLTGMGLDVKAQDRFLFGGNFNPNEAKALETQEQAIVFEARIQKLLEPIRKIDPKLKAFPDISVVLSHHDIEASASRLGQILIGSKVSILENWDQVEFLLAHEVAHIIDRHFKDEDTQNVFRTIALAGMQLATGGSKNKDGQATTETVALAMADELLFKPGLSRRSEAKADKIAMDILAWNGLNIDESSTLFSLLSADEEKRIAEFKAVCGDYIEENKSGGLLGGLGKALGSALGGQQPVNEAATTDEGERHVCDGQVTQGLFDQLTRTHSTNATRAKNLMKYQAKHYANYVSPPPREFSEEDKKNFFGANSSFARSSRASRAIQLMSPPFNNFEKGGELAWSSYDREDEISNKPRIAMYMLASQTDTDEEAISYLQPLLDNETAGAEVYRILLDREIRAITPLEDEISLMVRAKIYQSNPAYAQQQNQQQILADSGEAQTDATYASAPAEPVVYDPVKHQELITKAKEMIPTVLDMAITASAYIPQDASFHYSAIKYAALIDDKDNVEEGLAACAQAFPNHKAGEGKEGDKAASVPDMSAQMTMLGKGFTKNFSGGSKEDLDRHHYSQCQEAAQFQSFDTVFQALNQ